MKLTQNEIQFLKVIGDFLFGKNSKKMIVPTFKSKNPISNLDVKLNLLPPGIVELELNLKRKGKEYENNELIFEG